MTSFHKERTNDDSFHEFDKDLLRLSNYMYNNQNAPKKSPHYAAILQAIQKLDPDQKFLKIAEKFRPLATRSPALSVLSFQTKQSLFALVNDSKYHAEIQRDSLAATSKQSSASTYSLDEFEHEYQSNEYPLSSNDLLNQREGSGHTEQEELSSSSDGDISASSDSYLSSSNTSNISSEMEQMSHDDEKIIHTSLEDALEPSPEKQNKAIKLLIRYIQAYKATPAEERSAESVLIVTSIKCLCPRVLNKITSNIDPNFVSKLKKSDKENLVIIANANASTLNAFHDQSVSDDKSAFRYNK